MNADLMLGGVSAAELAQAYGTPLLVVDLEVFDESLRRYDDLARRYGVDVSYAAKAFSIAPLLARIAATSIGVDVCSLGELLVAERAGFTPERITFHGCGKSDEELEAVCAGRAGRIVVDNAEELERLAQTASGAVVETLLRLNPGIEADTHEFVRTGGEASKFGFVPDAFDAAVGRTLATPNLRLCGIHFHIGSNIFEAEPYGEAVAVALAAYTRAAQRGAPLGDLIAGGGFGIDPQPGGGRFDVGSALEVMLAACAAHPGAPRLGIEPGRALVADAGTSLYRVASVKQHATRRFAIVDGGLADNPRPALYDAYHHPVACGRSYAGAPQETLVCGRSCENDELASAMLPADLRAGDLLALSTTGAYTYSMSSNYNRFPRPAIAFAQGGKHRLAVRREPHDALLRFEVADAP